MRVFGVLLWVVALLFFMVAFSMDTSVPTGTGSRVHNIGLMRAQENSILIGIGLFIAGAIFIALGGKKRALASPASEVVGEQETKKCPFCAEIIKREAIKCRYCGSELPRENTVVAKAPDVVSRPQPSELAVQTGRLLARLLKRWRLLTAVAIVLVAVVLGIQYSKEQYDEWVRVNELRERQARNEAYINSIRADFQARKAEILSDVQRRLSEDRLDDAKNIVDRYRGVVKDADFLKLDNRVKIIELVKEYEAIPPQREHARMAALRNLVDADPENLRWRSELAQLEKGWGLPPSRPK